MSPAQGAGSTLIDRGCMLDWKRTPLSRGNKMRTLPRSAPSLALVVAALGPCALAQAQQTFTPKAIVQWGQGGDRERAMLTQMGYAQLAPRQFGLSVADLNSDGRPEIIVLSLGACDGAGCPVTALQNAGGGKVQQIFAQKLGGRLAITNETVNGYNAFAAADPAGAIMKDGAGRPLVYTVGATGQAAAAAAPPTSPPPAPAARPPAAAAGAPAAPPAAPPPAAAAANSRFARATGEGQRPWQTSGAEYIPVCTFPRCLSPKVVEKSGIGTDKALVRGEVTVEDATRWCETYNPGYRVCVEAEVTNNGSHGGMFGRRGRDTIEANCVAGTMRAIDGASYTYVGTWPDGPGAGRPKFGGAGGGTRIFEQQGAQQMASGQQSLNELAYGANSGESLALQWEILCKGSAPPAR